MWIRIFKKNLTSLVEFHDFLIFRNISQYCTYVLWFEPSVIAKPHSVFLVSGENRDSRFDQWSHTVGWYIRCLEWKRQSEVYRPYKGNITLNIWCWPDNVYGRTKAVMHCWPSMVECFSAILSFCVVAAVLLWPEDDTVSVIMLSIIVSSFVTDCNFNIVRCPSNGPVREVSP